MFARFVRNTFIALLFTACAAKTGREGSTDLIYEIALEKMTRGEESEFMWTHARSAVIPHEPPVVITTLSKTLKSGYKIYGANCGAESWRGPW